MTPSINKLLPQYFSDESLERVREILADAGIVTSRARDCVLAALLIRISEGSPEKLEELFGKVKNQDAEFQAALPLYRHWLRVRDSYAVGIEYLKWFSPVAWEIGKAVIPLGMTSYSSMNNLVVHSVDDQSGSLWLFVIPLLNQTIFFSPDEEAVLWGKLPSLAEEEFGVVLSPEEAGRKIGGFLEMLAKQPDVEVESLFRSFFQLNQGRPRNAGE